MRITRWTNSGYENGRIAARIGFPFKVPDLVRIVDPIDWQEAAKARPQWTSPLGLPLEPARFLSTRPLPSPAES